MILDDYQSKVLTDGHILSIAGAGCGKTQTIVEYMRYILDNNIAKDGSILYLSFTNKAAKEGAKRVGDKRIIAKTIHAYCYNEVKRINNQQIVKVIDKDILNEIISKMIPQSKYKSVNVDILEKYQIGINDSNISNAILEDVINMIHSKNYITFADMMLMYLNILNDPKYQPETKLTHIVVDEANDLCHIQYEIISKLARKTNATLVMVGDFRQSIYGFRGSDPSIMKKFEKEFNPKVIYLQKSYRCSGHILKASNKIANGMDYHTDILSDKSDGMIYNLGNNAIYEYISKIRRQSSTKNQTIAFLSRTNMECNLASAYLKKEEIPYVYLNNSNILSTAIGKTLKLLCMCIIDKSDFLSMGALMKRMKIGAGEKYLEKYPSMGAFIEGNHKKESMREFVKDVENLTNTSTIIQIIDVLKKYVEDPLNRYVWFIEDYGLLSIEDFIDISNVISDLDNVDDKEKDKYPIRLGTIHAAKGLEYDHVFLSLEWFINNDEKLDSEEDRVVYVGITRAKHYLYLNSFGYNWLATKYKI